MKNLVICFHGTNKENADAILKDGFKKGTYIAQNLEDALAYGGDYVFEVSFELRKLPNHWQFAIPKKVPPKRIVLLSQYTQKKILKNDKLRLKIFQTNF